MIQNKTACDQIQSVDVIKFTKGPLELLGCRSSGICAPPAHCLHKKQSQLALHNRPERDGKGYKDLSSQLWCRRLTDPACKFVQADIQCSSSPAQHSIFFRDLRALLWKLSWTIQSSMQHITAQHSTPSGIVRVGTSFPSMEAAQHSVMQSNMICVCCFRSCSDLGHPEIFFVWMGSAQHSTAQHSSAQHSTAEQSAAQRDVKQDDSRVLLQELFRLGTSSVLLLQHGCRISQIMLNILITDFL